MSNKHRLLIFVGLLSIVGVGVLVLTQGSRLGVFRGEPAAARWEDLVEGSGYVEVSGTAHYPVRVRQSYQGSWLRPGERTVHIFPFFPPGDTMGREIHILVLSETEPDRMLGLEDRKIRGEIRVPTSSLLTRGVLDTYREHAYQFTDDFLLLLEDPPSVE